MDFRDKIETYRTRCLAEVHAKNEDELLDAVDERVETGFEILNAYLDLKQALEVIARCSRDEMIEYCINHKIERGISDLFLSSIQQLIAYHVIQEAEQAEQEGGE